MESGKLNNSNFEGLMRGIVIDDVDEEGSGALGLYIPRLMNKSASQAKNQTKFHAESEVKSAKTTVEVECMWVRRSTLMGDVEQFIIPTKGQAVYVYAEDNDPQKLFYLPLAPVLDGELPTFDTMKLTQEYETYKKPEQIRNIVTLLRLPNGNVIGFDYNEDLNSFELSFGEEGHHFHVVENDDASYIELKTKEGDYIKLDNKVGDMTAFANRDIGAESTRDSSLTVGRHLTIKVEGNTTINTSGSTTVNTSGSTSVKSGGNMTIKAPKVSIN